MAGLVAEEFNSLFFRNAVNAGLPAMTLPHATHRLQRRRYRDVRPQRRQLAQRHLPALRERFRRCRAFLDIIASGGVLPRLAAQGYLPGELGDVLRSSAVAMRSAGSGA